MLDGMELWLRKAGGRLLTGVLITGYALGRERFWLPLRLAALLVGIGYVVECGVETWKLIRSRELAKTALDRLEAAER
ncbi:hypothetical protein [Streptomyces sp.]|uniref:hypothetical protein n=1 Tax=Streptomyces sp. TaxID=1931 RepID=UPI002D79708B|nr:hypothetical protein [Streptomyces sp.]HET6353478.1 hypothetical protein [Streptomyces sp.]